MVACGAEDCENFGHGDKFWLDDGLGRVEVLERLLKLKMLMLVYSILVVLLTSYILLLLCLNTSTFIDAQSFASLKRECHLRHVHIGRNALSSCRRSDPKVVPESSQGTRTVQLLERDLRSMIAKKIRYSHLQ